MLLFACKNSFFLFASQTFVQKKNRKKGYCNKIGWKMERKSWKIGWQISRSKENLPAFKSLIIRELRRNWKIWRIFSAI